MPRTEHSEGTATAQAKFSALVTSKLGLRPDPVRLHDALKLRTRNAGFACVEDYVNFLGGTSAASEWQQLSPLLTIPETYFFRHQAQWDVFMQYALPSVLAARKTTDPPLRIWSAACSTGEEPYTMAMAIELCGHGTQLTHQPVVGTDLVAERVETAREGRYSTFSVMRNAAAHEKRFFDRESDDYRVKPRYREAVRFEQLNLADAVALTDFIERNGPFDIIFCRNVLIYLEPQTYDALVNAFVGGLRDDGMIFLGASDFPQLKTNSVRPERIGGTYIWIANDCELQARGDKPGPAPSVTHASSRSPSARASQIRNLPAAPAHPSRAPQVAFEKPAPVPGAVAHTSTVSTNPSQSPWSELGEVMAKLRSGESQSAQTAARALTQRHQLCADAHFALGVTLEALGTTHDALVALNKSVYLDGGFAQARWKRALLLNAAGKADSARAEARAALHHLANETEQRIDCFCDVSASALAQLMSQTLDWVEQGN